MFFIICMFMIFIVSLQRGFQSIQYKLGQLRVCPVRIVAEEHFVEAPLGGPQLEVHSIRNTLFLWEFFNDRTLKVT